jgi:hypothetical protein
VRHVWAQQRADFYPPRDGKCQNPPEHALTVAWAKPVTDLIELATGMLARGQLTTIWLPLLGFLAGLSAHVAKLGLWHRRVGDRDRTRPGATPPRPYRELLAMAIASSSVS